MIAHGSERAMSFGRPRTRDVVQPAGRTRLGATRLLIGLAGACVDRLRSRVDCLVERRRLNAARRNPTALVVRLTSVKRVLIVCHGNIIRSPFAAALIARALGDRSAVAVASAGLTAIPGRPAHPTGILTAVTHGIDLSAHAASPVSAEAVANADLILLMDVAQAAAIRRRFKADRAKTFLLTTLATAAPLEIADPVDGDEAVFRNCYEHISCAVRPIVGVLAAVAQRHE